MSLFTDAWQRLRALLLPGRMDAELDEELRFHLERATEEGVRRGLPRAEALRRARMALDVEVTREATRDARGTAMVEHALADARFALRALSRNPGFTAGVIAILAIAIGACTTMFSVIDRVLVAELPYPHAARLVMIHMQNTPTNIWNISTVDYQAVKAQQRSFDAFGAISPVNVALSGGTAPPTQIRVGRATLGFFRALSVTPAAGRLVSEADEVVGAPAVLVASHALATEQLGGVREALGRTLTLDGVSHTVVGVLAPGVGELAGTRAAAWSALQMPAPTRRGPFWMRGIARLREGLTLADARRDLALISRRLEAQWSSSFRDTTANITPFALKERLVGRSRGQIGLFTAAVLLVLLVAVANVATLMLVRASARSGELAVREALGAGRGRLFGLVVTECVVLTLLAGGAGIVLALLGVRLLPSLIPALPRLSSVRVDGRAVLVALGLALLSGLLASLAPVSMLRRGRAASLRIDERRVGAGRGTQLLRGLFVTAEFALALPLLLGACLLLTSFLRLTRVDRGFDPRGMLAVPVALPQARYPDDTVVTAFWRRLEQRLAAVPGVRSAAVTTVLPPNDQFGNSNFNLKDRPVPENTSEPVGFIGAVTPAYFAALGIRLLDGRTFTAADTMTSDTTVRAAMVVSRAWAEAFYPGESPLGKEVAVGGCWDCPDVIVGVVENVKYVGLGATDEMMYNAVAQARPRTGYVVVGGDGSAALEARVLDAVRGLDPDLPLRPIRLAERVSESLSDPLRGAAILSAFAASAVVLAAVGVFALMSFTVRQRRREIGVRIALGAQPGAVTRMIVGRGMRHAALGVALGLVIAVIGERWIRGMLFGVSVSDPLTILLAAAGTLLAALLASWVPGRRAARIHPVEAINTE